jgi:predicted nucleic acid-binding protein
MSADGGRFFLDTNVFVYTFDDRVPSKRDTARSLVSRALKERAGVISFQIVQEFLNLATRRFATPLSPADCAAYVDSVLAPLCEVHSTIELYREALDIRERWRFGFYDALVVAAAHAAGCDRLYSEDLQHGQKVRDLTITNPFADATG